MTDFCMVNDYIESLFIKISNDTMPLVIGRVYCPPNDCNVDLLKHDLHSLTENCLEAMYSNSLLPTILKPTRETATIATLIDNVFTNKYSINDNIVQCIFATDIVKHKVKSLFWVHIQAQSSALKTLTSMVIGPFQSAYIHLDIHLNSLGSIQPLTCNMAIRHTNLPSQVHICSWVERSNVAWSALLRGTTADAPAGYWTRDLT